MTGTRDRDTPHPLAHQPLELTPHDVPLDKETPGPFFVDKIIAPVPTDDVKVVRPRRCRGCGRSTIDPAGGPSRPSSYEEAPTAP